jgi:hypothetical protein
MGCPLAKYQIIYVEKVIEMKKLIIHSMRPLRFLRDKLFIV